MSADSFLPSCRFFLRTIATPPIGIASAHAIRAGPSQPGIPSTSQWSHAPEGAPVASGVITAHMGDAVGSRQISKSAAVPCSRGDRARRASKYHCCVPRGTCSRRRPCPARMGPGVRRPRRNVDRRASPHARQRLMQPACRHRTRLRGDLRRLRLLPDNRRVPARPASPGRTRRAQRPTRTSRDLQPAPRHPRPRHRLNPRRPITGISRPRLTDHRNNCRSASLTERTGRP